MTSSLSLLVAPPALAKAHPAARAGNVERGIFAQLLPSGSVAQNPTHAPTDQDDSFESAATTLAEAERALVEDDLSEEDEAALVGSVLVALASNLVQTPQSLERLHGLMAALPDNDALQSVDSSGKSAREHPLAHALMTLRAFVIEPEAHAPNTNGIETPSAEMAALVEGADITNIAEADLDEILARLPQRTTTALSELAARLIAASEDVTRQTVPVAVGSLMHGVLGASRVLAGETDRAVRNEILDQRSAQGQDIRDAALAKHVDLTPATVRAALSPEAVVSAAHLTTAPFEAAAGASASQDDTAVVGQSFAPVASSQSNAAASPAATAPMPQPSSEQILGQMRANVGQDGAIKVALRPEGLGRLEVELARSDDGQLRVMVRAEQGPVLTALRADREGLVALLRDAGHRVEDSALNFSDFGTGNQGARSGQHRDQGQQDGLTTFTGAIAPQAQPQSAASAHFISTSATTDGVDINV